MAEAIECWPFMQWFDPWRQQLEKVVYLDENSSTHTKSMTEQLEQILATMSAVVCLVRVWLQLMCKAYFCEAQNINSNRVID